MIPMRDGIKLFTSIYLPKDSSYKHPILLSRTPYGCEPYGESKFTGLLWWRVTKLFLREKYIYVKQDVRGRFMSEGDFKDIRPYNPDKKGVETDEASDAYDTIDWLIKNLSNNNGNVGIVGISYPGFYATMAAICGHPALKAVSPQAPPTDWFIGDDFHHNGAFMLIDAFEYYKDFGIPRPLPVKHYNPGYAIKEPDRYRFYLETGPLKNFSAKYLADSIAFWNDLMNHPVYDNWWKKRNSLNHTGNIQPAILTVGGLFDAEDCFGSWHLYEAIEKNNPADHYNKIVMGPWFHGDWEGRGAGDHLGRIKFGAKTSEWYQENIEFPFFQHFLNNTKEEKPLSEATVFFTGENRWKQFDQWPPSDVKEKALYLQPRGSLSFVHPRQLSYQDRPDNSGAFTQYTSDPAKPVPFDGPDTIKVRTREYMTNDQRFAAARKDVISFRTAPLNKDITLAGRVYADLMVSVSGTDADFVAKLIDVFPNNIAHDASDADTIYKNDGSMNGYQMLVRGEVMRGKFRNSYEKPEPMVPNKITHIRFALNDVAHTFQKGHRIMVQIQSSWFPLVDRNPQTFTDIYKASEADFQKASISIFHTEGVASKIILPVLE